MILCIYLRSLQFGGRQCLVLWPQFSDGSEKSCRFLFCSAFFVILWMRQTASKLPYVSNWKPKATNIIFYIFYSFNYMGSSMVLGKSVGFGDLDWGVC